jgi:hypothetical protein
VFPDLLEANPINLYADFIRILRSNVSLSHSGQGNLFQELVSRSLSVRDEIKSVQNACICPDTGHSCRTECFVSETPAEDLPPLHLPLLDRWVKAKVRRNELFSWYGLIFMNRAGKS